MKLDWAWVIEGGEFRLREERAFLNAVLTHFGSDSFGVMTLKQGDSRSNRQLRYLFGVVYDLASKEWGYTRDEMHEICKERFLKRTYHVGQEDVTAPGSTKGLTVGEMTEFIDRVRQFFAEHGLNTPDPHE